MECFWCVRVVAAVWTALDVVDGLGILLAVLRDVVRDLTSLTVIDGSLPIRFESAKRP